jgi:hypothetical protein
MTRASPPVLERLGIKDPNIFNAFDHVSVRIIKCLQTITALAGAVSR